MLVGNILHSCGNERVAEAAVVSIGGEFAERLRSLAARCELSVGDLVGRLVRRFAHEAAERDWRFVIAAMEGKDLPVLCGLRAIIDCTMRKPSTAVYLATLASEAGEGVPVWTVSPDMRVEGLSCC